MFYNGAEISNAIIRGIYYHHELIRIHPFADGNGRTTRVLTTLYLGLRGYDFRHALVLDTYYAVDRKAYYQALNLSANYKGRREAELNPWLEYFIDGFLSSVRVLAVEVTLLTSAISHGFAKPRISRDEIDLLSYVQQFGAVTPAEAQSVLPSKSRRTVQRKLKNLIDTGYLKIKGSTHNVQYVRRKNHSL